MNIEFQHSWINILRACFIVLTITFSPHLAFATAPDISVSSISGVPGTTVSVPVVADFDTVYNSIQFALSYDPNLLTVSNVSVGSAVSSWTTVNNQTTPGTVVVGMFNPGTSSTSVSGSQQQIAIITFSVVNPPGDSSTTSDLALSSVIFDTNNITQLTSGSFSLLYSLSLNTSGNGTVSVSPNTTSYPIDSQVTLTATPATGYQFSNWSGSASGSTNPLILTMTDNMAVLANFTQLLAENITVSSGANGTISPSGPTVSVNSGASQTFTLSPNSGYSAKLTVDGTVVTLTNNAYTLSNITISHTVAASFYIANNNEPITSYVTTAGGGTISPNGQTSVTQGANLTFTLTPNPGFTSSITVDNVAETLTNNTYTLNDILASHTVKASFSLQNETLTVTPPGTGGTITPSGPSITVPYGANQAFVVSPNPGYVAQLTVDGLPVTLTNNTYNLINVITSHTIAATFSLQPASLETVTVTASAGSGGSISPSGTTNVLYGTNQQFTISPNAGYIPILTLDGITVPVINNSYELLDVIFPHILAVSFTLQNEIITATTGTDGTNGIGGTISPSGSAGVAYGTNQPFTISPNEGYNFTGLSVDGIIQSSLPANNTYTFTNVITNHTIAATFTQQTEAITVTTPTNGTISPSGPTVNVNYGSSQIFTVTPATGYSISQVLVDNLPVTLSTSNTYTFTEVTVPHTISATFAQDTTSLPAEQWTYENVGQLSVTDASGGQQYNFAPSSGYTPQLSVNGQAASLSNNSAVVNPSSTVNGVTTATGVNISFAVTTVPITVTYGANGSVNTLSYPPYPSSTPIASGTVLNANYNGSEYFTAIPNAGYTSLVTVDGNGGSIPGLNIQGVGNAYNFSNLTTAHTINFNFILYRTVFASAGSGGSISPSGLVTTSYGSSQEFIITPQAGYVAQLTVDGVITPLTNNTYALNNITASHNIAVSFTPQLEAIASSVTSSSSNFGTISPSGKVYVNYGASQLFNLTANTGFIPQLQVNGSTVTLTNNSYTLANVITGTNAVVASFSVATETINASISSGASYGTMSPSGLTTLNYGANQTYNFFPQAGYVATVYVDSNPNPVTLTNNSYTFTNLTASHTLSVTFSAQSASTQTETVTVSAGSGGTISPSGNVSVTYGTNQLFTITPNAGYVPVLTIDGINIPLANNTYELLNVTANHTLTVSFSPQNEIIYASGGTNGSNGIGGTISPYGNFSVPYTANQNFTIKPNEGYSLTGLTVDGLAVSVSLTTTTYSFSYVTTNHTIAATFSPTPVLITVIPPTNGTISPSGPTVNVPYGSAQIFTVTPAVGYAINQVLVDNLPVALSSANTYTFTQTIAKHSIAAIFTPSTTSLPTEQWTIPNGQISVSDVSGGHQYSLAPAAGYAPQLTVDGSVVTLTNNTYTINSSIFAHSMIFNFIPISITLTVNAGSNGTVQQSGLANGGLGPLITTATNLNTIFNGPLYFSVTPNSGYATQLLIDNSTVVTNSASFTTIPSMNIQMTSSAVNFSNLTSSHIVSFNFVPNITLIASAGSGGTISPSGAINVNPGANQEFTITPSTGYTPLLTVDGAPVILTSNTFTINNITASHVIGVSFVQSEPVTASASVGGTISPSGTINVNYGANQTFTLTPNTGYNVNQLKVNNSPVTLTGNSYTLNNVTAATTVAASYKLQTETVATSAGANGTISTSCNGSTCTNPVNYGTVVTFTANPSTGYGFTWGNGSNTSACYGVTTNTCTLTITSNTTVFASFSTAYNITITQVPGAIISCTIGTNGPPCPSSVAGGTLVIFSATTSPGYQFNFWQDSLSSSTNPYSYTVNATTTATAYVSPRNQTIQVSFGSGGTISPNNSNGGTISVLTSANQTFTVTPLSGYAIGQVLVDGSPVTLTNNTYTFTNITTSHSIAASFVWQFNASSGDGGTVTTNNPTQTNSTIGSQAYQWTSLYGQVSVADGTNGDSSENQTFTFTPNPGYSGQLTIDGSVVPLTNNAYTIANMTQPHTVSIGFNGQSYSITVNAGIGGTVTSSCTISGLTHNPCPSSVPAGTNETFTFIPTSGVTPTYTAEAYLDCTQGSTGCQALGLSSNSYTLSDITSSHTLNVYFGQQNITLTSSLTYNNQNDQSGTISPFGIINVPSGSNQTYTLTPADPSYNVSLTDNGVNATLTQNTYTLYSVTTAHSLVAAFTPTFNLTVSNGTNGTISPSGTLTVTAGKTQTFTLTPATGYSGELIVDGSPVTLTNNTYTLINIQAPHTITANFNIPVAITANISNGVGNGTIYPSGNFNVNYGSSQIFTLNPNLGYSAQLNVDSLPVVLTNNTYTLTNITTTHTLSANFNNPTLAITSSVSGSNGSISPSGSLSVNYASSQTFTLTPNANYSASLAVDGSPVTLTNNAYTLTNIIAAHSVVASFIPSPESITASVQNGFTSGTIFPSGTFNASYGTTQTFTLYPTTGYAAQLNVDGSPVTLTNNTYVLTINGPHTLVANFYPTTFAITATVNATSSAYGSMSPTGTFNVNYGTSQSFTLTPNTGYSASLIVDGSYVALTNNAYTLNNITTTHTVTAYFTPTFEYINANILNGNGTLSPSGYFEVNYGANQTFTITPSTGYTASVVVDNSPVTFSNNTYTLSNVTSNHVLAVNFTGIPETFTTSINALHPNGTISPGGITTVPYGTNNEYFTLIPENGYSSLLTVDGTPVALTNNTYNFQTVTGSHTLVASFYPAQTITASAGSNGTISPSGNVSVSYQANQTFTVTPFSGYAAQLTVDGVAAGLYNNTYTFSNVTSNHTIAVTFISQNSAGVITTGLEGWWTFSSSGNPSTTAPDSSGNSYTGTLLGSSLPVWTTNCNQSGFNCLSFNSADDQYVSINDASNLDFGNGDFSITLWVNTSSTSIMRMVNKWLNSSSVGYLFDINSNGTSNSPGSLRLKIQDTSGNKSDVNVAAGILTGTWEHIAVTVHRNSSTGIIFYLNGAQVGSFQSSLVTTGSISNTASLAIGTVPTILGSYFNGSIRDVRVYNRALSLSDINSIYQNQTSYFASITADSPTYNAPANPLLTATAALPNGDTINHVEFYINNNGNLVDLGAGQVGSSANIYNFIWNSAPVGTYAVMAVVTDNSGIQYPSSPVSITVNPGVPETITASVNSLQSGGSISPSGTFSVLYGSSQTFTLTPNSGYTAQLTIDGVAVTLTNNTYALNNVSGPHTVIASFYLSQTITVSAGSNGLISPSGNVSVIYGANQTFTLTPFSGYMAQLTVDGTVVPLTSNNTYTLSNVTSNHALVATFSPQSSSGIVTSNLEGWWAFNEGSGTSAGDSSGNSNIGTLINSPVWSTNCIQTGLNCLNLNGSNQYITINDAPSLDFGTGDFSIGLWVNSNSSSSIRMVNKWLGSSSVGYLFDLNSTTSGSNAPGSLRFRMQDSSSTDNTDTSVVAGLIIGTWNFVAVTVHRNSSTGITFYLNGTQIGTSQSSTATPGSISNTAVQGIGTIPNLLGSYLNGSIKGVRVYNRALSSSDIASLYQEYSTITLTTDNATYTTPANPVLTATTSLIGSSISNVEFYSDNNGVITDLGAGQVGSSSNIYNFTWNSAPAGNYSMMAITTTSAGVRISSFPVTISITAPAAPLAPTGLEATANNNEVILSWSASSGATSYTVERSTSSNGTYSALSAGTGILGTIFADNTAVDGTTYYYKVEAINSGGTSALSSDVFATPEPPAPLAPIGLTATAGNNQVSLSWTLSPGATGYTVERSTNSNGAYLSLSASIGITGTTFIDSTAVNGTTYYYEVEAINGGGTSSLSSDAFATPEPPIPSAPTNLTATAGNNQVSLSWAASLWATNYTVERSTTSNGTYSVLSAGTGINGTTFIDSTAINGTTYYYEVEAINGGGISALSSDVIAIPEPPAPLAPSSLTAIAGNAQVSLSWDPSSGATSYTVERATSSNGPFTALPLGTNITTATFIDSSNGQTTVVNGTTYYYEVEAINAGGASALTAEVSATPEPHAPSAPTGLTATAGNSQVDLIWIASSGATSYTVERSTSSNGTYSALSAGTGIPGTTFTDSTAVNGTTYYYEVEAINGGGTSALSSDSFATPEPPAPSAPTGLTATAGNNQVSLTWILSLGATSYTVERSTSSNGIYSALSAGTGISGTTFIDTTAVNGTTYYYEVKAINGGGSSTLSLYAFTTPEPTVPSAPTGLTATAGNNQVNLSWIASSGATSYTVERSASSNGTYIALSAGIGISGTIFIDTTAVNGTTYYYEVEAINGGGRSALSINAFATPEPPIPAAPINLMASASDNQVVLSWTASSGATSYTVERLTSSNGTYLALNEGTGITELTFTDSTAVNGITYYYEVEAINGGGTSALSSSAFATPEPPAPLAPTNLTTTAGNNQVTLQWTASLGATSYTVERSTSSNGTYSALSAGTGISGTTFTDGTAVNGTTYYYEVEAINSGGTSVLSSDVFATPQPPASLAPTGLIAIAGNNQVLLQWNASLGALTYTVERSNSSNGTYVALSAGTGISVTAFTDSTAVNGITYYYRVEAINGGGTSALSSFTFATPEPPAPSTPTGLIATAGNNQVTLSWTASSGATSYTVERSTSSNGTYTVLSAGAAITGITFTDNTAVNGTTYYYEVEAINDGGTSDLSSDISATPEPPAPSTPIGLTAAAGNNQVILSWTASSGAASYTVERSISSNGIYAALSAGTEITGTTFTDSAAANGTTYYYEVEAINGGGASALSSNAFATPEPLAPLAPTNLTTTPGNNQVTLQWTASIGATSYTVQRSTSSNGTYLALSSGTGISGTTFIDSTAINGTTYYYEVEAINGGGTSALSSDSFATPEPPAPSVPTGLTATAGDNLVTLSWTASSGATSYTIERAASSNGIYSALAAGTGITGTTFIDSTASNGIIYYYEVEALNAGGTSTLSSFAFATPVSSLPAVPANLSVNAGNNQVSLSWTASAGATNYTVERSTSSNGTFLALSAGTGISGTIFTDNTVVNGTTYYYEVEASNSDGTSALSSYVSATPQALAPSTPIGLTASAGNNQVNLTWITSLGATNYTVERSISSNGTYAALSSGTGISGTTFTDNTAVNGTTYFYEVEASNGSGTSALSLDVSATPELPIPAAPTGLAATAGNNQVALSWTASNGATSYTVERSTNGDGTFSVLSAATGINGTTFTDSTVANGITYYYEIEAINGSGTSPLSLAASATPEPPAPAVPTGLTASAGNNQVSLIWIASSGATSYSVERSMSSSGTYTTLSAGAEISGTAFTDNSALNGTTYYYEVEAINGGGTSAPSVNTSATPKPPAPSTPTNVIATASNNEVVLSWAPSLWAASYTVASSTDGVTFSTLISNLNSISYTNTSLTNGTTYYYEVQAINISGNSAFTSPVSATPSPAPTKPIITIQPTNQTVNSGAIASFSVTVNTNSTGITYQWQKNGNNISGATEDSYSTPATVNSDDQSTYNVLISNSIGTTISNTATLTVNYAPVINVQPSNVTVISPATASFSVSVSAEPPPSYQWVISVDGGITFANINGATSSTYTTPSTILANNAAEYQCVITNKLGSVTSAAAIMTVDNILGATTSSSNLIPVSSDQVVATPVSGDATSQTAQTISLTASAGTGGTISPSGSVSVKSGADQAFTVTASPGYSVDEVSVDGSPMDSDSNGNYTISNVLATHEITASFTPNTYDLAVTVGGGGTMSPAGDVSVLGESSQTFTLSPDDGYTPQLTVDGTAVTLDTNNSYTLSNVVTDHTIVANFIANYTLSASAGEGGSISPSGDITITSGSNQSFVVTANAGYKIKEILIDDSPTTVNSDGSFTLNNIVAAHIIKATFLNLNSKGK